MNKTIKRLPDSELEVMQAVWRCEVPAKRSEIEAWMEHEIAVTTLLTLLTRLSEKGFLKVEKQSRSSVYTPLVSEQEYLSSQSKRFIDKLCRGNLSAFASALTESGLSKEEIEELRELLKKDEL